MPDDVPVQLPIEKRLAAAVERYGESVVVARAVSLLAGNNEGEDFLLYLGGEHARGVLDGAPVLYWPELWGTRALLYVWDDAATEAVGAALHNQAWRVREMGARVAAVRGLPVAGVLTGLLDDEVARVRAAAARALGVLGEESTIDALRPLLKDAEIDVRRGAQHGIDALKARLG